MTKRPLLVHGAQVAFRANVITVPEALQVQVPVIPLSRTESGFPGVEGVKCAWQLGYFIQNTLIDINESAGECGSCRAG